MGITGDQNDKDVLAWVSGLVRMLNDVEQITGFDGNHHGLEGNASLKLKDLVLASAPAKGFHSNTLRPCVPFVISLWVGDWGGTTRRDPNRGDGLTSRPKQNLARSPGSRHHHSMPPPPSATYQRLREYIAERMRMSHIYQPLMLMELLGRRSPAPAQDVARRILGEDVTQINYYTERVKRMVGKVLTGNGITRYGNGAYSLIGGDELSDSERDELLQLCRQRLDGFRAQRGEEVYCCAEACGYAHRSRHRTPISGSVKYRVLTRARGRCECCGAHEHQRALEVAPIITRNQGGSDDISNLQALCFRCNAGKRDTDRTDFRGVQASYGQREAGCVFCALEGSGRVLLEYEPKSSSRPRLTRGAIGNSINELRELP